VRILGIVSDTHDTGVALVEDGVPVFVVEEERLNRDKHTKAFPKQALKAVLAARGLALGDVDAITIPWRVGRLRKMFLRALVARPPQSFNLARNAAHTAQNKSIVALKQILSVRMAIATGAGRLPPLVGVGHHDSHAAMFFVSPFEDAQILVMDGYGEDAATTIYSGRGNRVERRWSEGPFNSIGMIYTFLTQYLGFAGFSDEGKVMALAAYGDDRYVARFRDCIRLLDGGRYAIDMSYFEYDAYGLIRPFSRKFLETFGPPRMPGAPLEDRHKAIARALQVVTEETILHVVREMTRTQPSRNLVFTGGVALNCVANARILAGTDIERIWVPPCASDSGAPLGSALWHYHQTNGGARGYELRHPYLGLAYEETEARQALLAAGLSFETLDDAALIETTARALAERRIVAWHQGAFEIGPRALGNRSILADPRGAEIRDLLNAKVKQREPFRPFAPAVLAERASEFFEIDQLDPFMTLAPRVRPDKRSLIPAATHIDGTGRIQTVERRDNPRYYDLIARFGDLTGVPILLNTSFNRQEPIVATPTEAVSCFLRTEMDVLVIGNLLARRRG
jgi:carbamoyltransferase